MTDCVAIDRCRVCDAAPLETVLDLGETPLANRLLREDQLRDPEPRYPLCCVYCPGCSLLQIRHTVAPEILFRDYVYQSSVSDAAVAHADAHVQTLIEQHRLGAGSRIIEVASNDGYLLQHAQRAGVPVLGIEPAQNIAKLAEERGIPTRAEFFDRACGERLVAEGITANAVLGNNVLAHVPDPRGFVGGAAALLRDGGVVEFEFPYVGDLVEKLEFDTIYHEHLSYFSAHAIEALFAAEGLVLTDVSHWPIHGGSLRVTGAHRADPAGRARVEALLEREREFGMDRRDFYTDFAKRVDQLRDDLRALLAERVARGERIVAYGASAKGSTLLNYCGIGRETLAYVVDRSPVKQGLFTPGTHLPIHGPERLVQDQPPWTLLLTWNFAEEIAAQQTEYRSRGGRFLVPVPEPGVLEDGAG
ncbi:MAG: class I SAM-dependent methyltransferase [Myxococcota bacterium]